MTDTRFKTDKGLLVTGSNSLFDTDVSMSANLYVTGDLLSVGGDLIISGNIVYSNAQLGDNLLPSSNGVTLGNTTNRFDLYAEDINVSQEITPISNTVNIGNTTNRFVIYSSNTSVAGLLTVSNSSTFSGPISVPTSNVHLGGVGDGTQTLHVDGDILANGTIYVKTISANGGVGTSGQVLLSNGSGAYWSTVAGFTGSQGSAGGVGFSGSVGFVGSRGSTGFTGSLGFVGSQGSSGASGYAGSQGFTGVTGFTGSAGNNGYSGSTGGTGASGYTGSGGTNGYTGSISFTGSRGFTGSVGSSGASGFTGSAAVIQSSLAGNGYTKLNNGVIIQWGTFTALNDNSTTVTFPTSYTTLSRVVVSGGYNINNQQDNGPFTLTTSTSSFTAFSSIDSFQPNTHYVAMGY